MTYTCIQCQTTLHLTVSDAILCRHCRNCRIFRKEFIKKPVHIKSK